MSLSVNPLWYYVGEVMSPPELPEAGHLARPLLAWRREGEQAPPTRQGGVTNEVQMLPAGSNHKWEKKGAALLLVRHCEAAGHTQFIHKVHCILHQESLCAKSASVVNVMSVVVKVVNSILSRSLNHCQF